MVLDLDRHEGGSAVDRHRDVQETQGESVALIDQRVGALVYVSEM